jgi:phage baseplate assembly protein gpV
MNGVFKKDSLKLSGFYRGEVVDNTDPDQLGRIKVEVFGVFDGGDISSENLPWAVPAQSIFTGSGSGYGHFAVPEVGSHVFVFFEGGDVYQPCYVFEAPSRVYGQPSERTTNYPDRKIWKTVNGIVIYVDDKDKVVRLTHPTGKYIQMDGNGNVTISAGDVTIQASGEIGVTASGNITISGAQVDINP